MVWMADSHVHTSFSDDSHCSMEDMIKRALAMGLNEITFTEHVDYGVKSDLNCNYEHYFALLRALQARFHDQILIRGGIEFGVQTQTVTQYQKDVHDQDFDFILLSIHQIDNKQFWNQSYQQDKTPEQIRKDYYAALFAVQKVFKDYDALAHLDLIERYVKIDEEDPEWILELVDPILRILIEEGRSLEVNTSCYRYGLKDLTPSRFILAHYRDMGGRLLTLGSDAHDEKHLAHHMKDVRQMLKDLGFKEFCTYEKRQLQFHEL